MEPEAKYTLVGVGILVLSALLVFAALWLDKSENDKDLSFYTIYFKKHSLAGLQVDSDVTMRGIKVGSVKDWMISPNDIELVQVTVRLRPDTPVKTDSRAVINRNLLTGLANIDLTESSQSAPALTEVRPEELYPVIPEGDPGLEEIKNTLPELLNNLNQMVSNASLFFSDSNQKAFSDTIKNLQSVSDRLQKGEGDLAETLQSISDFSSELAKLGRNFNQRIDGVSQAIESAADTVTREVSSLSQELSSTARSVSSTLENYENPRALIAGPNSESLGPGEGARP